MESTEQHLQERRELVKQLSDRYGDVLDQRERDVITYRWGLDQDEPRTIEEAAAILKMSPMGVMRISQRADRKLTSAAQRYNGLKSVPHADS